MRFRTFLPCEQLSPFVQSLAIHENETAETYKVLPGTGFVFGFQYRGRLNHLSNGENHQLSISGVSGLSDAYKVFQNSPDIGTVLVFFKETGARAFFKEPLHELFRESLSLDHFILNSELLVLEEQLAEMEGDIARIKLVEKFLIDRLDVKPPDALVLRALTLIHQSAGNIRIKALCEDLNISQSPFEKRFRKEVGVSAKKFASIVRMKAVINKSQSLNSLTEVAYEGGFYDQSHFIKEFRTFTGDTPEQFFDKR